MLKNNTSSPELDQFRPVPFYFLDTTAPEAYTSLAIQKAMQRVKALGYGGIVLFNKPPLGFDAQGYLSKQWFDLTKRFILACIKLNLQLWINDGFNYPPGDAAGRIEAADPTLKQLRLKPNKEGRLEVLEVPWGFPAFEEPKSHEYFHRFVYEEYYRHFAQYFGNGITGFFSDADNRRFNAQNARECKEQYYPWSSNFSSLFASRHGYRIETRLKELFADEPSKVKEDYWQLCGELYQAWFAANHTWCQAHNVLYSFHSSDTGPLNYERCRRSSAFTEGEPLMLLSHSDYPGTDHEILILDGGTHYDNRMYTPKVTLGGGTEYLTPPRMNDTSLDIRAKYAGSAAVLGGKQRCLCEMFAATNWGVTYNDLQRIAAWQIIQGVNFIVPHAVHHCFNGKIKFFAPPEYTHTTMQYGLRQFNDTLARWCQAASAGEYVAEYAVIDPTRKVWNNADSQPFFDFCDKLNRRAEGYIIVPEGYDGPISNVVDTLKKPSSKLPKPCVTFSGGELAYMRRSLNGEEYLLVANIWQPKALSGNLLYNGKTYEIELEPGEIAIFGGPFEAYRNATKRKTTHTFNGRYDVAWKDKNIIPFEKQIDFAAPAGMEISLLVPAGHKGKVSFNKKQCHPAFMLDIFGDKYQGYALKTLKSNSISLENAAEFTTPALLQGNFDVALETQNDYCRKAHTEYLLEIYEPEAVHYTLSPRCTQLSLDCGWEKQGQVFYSGEALVDLGEIAISKNSCLELPGFKNTAELLVDDTPTECRTLAPYRFNLPTGKHNLKLRIWNTMANRLERYAAPSGLTSQPVIVVCD
ncbi:MAG: hypothetical protein IJS08_06225 [Victivallales bacterium]|nr:hypothetical protein [Victivallales bacterium]